MSAFIDRWLEPGLWLLGDWSLRWGVLIILLGLWFAVRPPRQAALRLAVCQFVLLAGLALPLVPRWWGHNLLPARAVAIVDAVRFEQPMSVARDPALRPSIAELKPVTGTGQSRSTALAKHGIPETAEPESILTTPATRPEPLGAFRIVLLCTAGLWLAGLCVQLTRLISGVFCLSRLPRGTRPPSVKSKELFDRCREEMGLRRAVQLGIHPTLGAPVFVGGWRSWILVPIDWEQLGPEGQRAVLWHEMTHVARGDDLLKIAEEVVRAFFFFHPLVSWLLNRIDAYREQVCDSAVVRRGVAGRMLAQVLVDFSCRRAEPSDRSVALRPALPFFRRRTVKNRICELLEEATLARWSAPLVRRQFVGLLVIAISTGIALGGVGLSAAGSPAESPPVTDSAPKSPPPAAPAGASEKAAAMSKAAEVPKTLDRILANWKARQARTRSLYASWESRVFFGQEAEARASGKTASHQAASSFCRVRYWAEWLDGQRSDGAPGLAPGPGTTAPGIATPSAVHRLAECRVEDPGDAAGSPLCTAWLIHDQRETQAYWKINPLALAFHPLDVLFLNAPSPRFRVVTEDAPINGVHCIEIENADGPSVEKCWVDPARDDVIIAYELRLARPNVKISFQYQRDGVHGWVPAFWSVWQRWNFTENRATKFTINEQFPEQTSNLKLSPGTVVFDMRTAEQYRAAADGGKTNVFRFDSRASMRVAQFLETRTDFQIEPQSFQDTIDFVAVQYQIPILLKKADFDAARVDTAAEVAVRRGGIKVADLLKDISAQFGKPVGFRIEDEVLKMSPKFTEHGALHIRPAPVLPANASAKERKIQAALEMPVDFNIEPQSLKDALDYIAARYQIRIRIDRRINSKIEVKGAFPGVKLRSLLTMLLQECPGNLGFKIERDALQIDPAPVKPESGAGRS
jgi:beta-lactamase regulating signal transducer with metallopeptidase domain